MSDRGGAAPNRRAVALRIVALVAIIALVFAVVLPRIVDADAVRSALTRLSAGELGALIAATVVAFVLTAGPARVLVRGLTWPRAVMSDLVGRAVASTIPGPSDMAIKSVLYREWGLSVDSANAGLALASLFEPLASLALPLVALVGLIASGEPATQRAIGLAGAGVVLLGLAALTLTAIVRSDRLARRVGEGLQRAATRLWRLVHRRPPSGIAQGVLDFRVRSKDLLSRRGALGLSAAIVAKLAWFVVFEVALGAVGLTPDVLAPPSVLAAMAVVGIVALIPVTPGAVGVTEVAYVGLLSSVAGPGTSEAITAAVLLFRTAQWLAPIPIGWILLLVLRGREIAVDLAGGPA